MGLVFIELDPDVFPFFGAAFHFGKGHEDASFGTDVDEGAETGRIDDRCIADLADFDFGQAHGGCKASRRVVVQEYRHGIADMDLFRLLIDMEEDVVVGIARAAVQEGAHFTLAQDFEGSNTVFLKCRHIIHLHSRFAVRRPTSFPDRSTGVPVRRRRGQ